MIPKKRNQNSILNGETPGVTFLLHDGQERLVRILLIGQSLAVLVHLYSAVWE